MASVPTEWYYSSAGQQLGPVSPKELKELATSGQLAPTDLVWREGMPEWKPASSVKGLLATTSQSAPPPLPLPVQAVRYNTQQPTELTELADDQLLKTPLPHPWFSAMGWRVLRIVSGVFVGCALLVLFMWLAITVPVVSFIGDMVSGQEDRCPPLQMEFESKRNEFNERYHAAPNEIQQSAIWVEANQWTTGFGQRCGMAVTDWHGQIHEISTDQGGDVVFIKISSRMSGTLIIYGTYNDRVSDDSVFGAADAKLKLNKALGREAPTVPLKGSRIYNQVSQLTEGDHVRFSATLLPHREKGIREISITESGSLQEPSFIVRFKDITQMK